MVKREVLVVMFVETRDDDAAVAEQTTSCMIPEPNEMKFKKKKGKLSLRSKAARDGPSGHSPPMRLTSREERSGQHCMNV